MLVHSPPPGPWRHQPQFEALLDNVVVDRLGDPDARKHVANLPSESRIGHGHALQRELRDVETPTLVGRGTRSGQWKGDRSHTNRSTSAPPVLWRDPAC
jgi:hypothetical protein